MAKEKIEKKTSTKKTSKKKGVDKKEKVEEVFKIEKDDKEKIIKTHGTEIVKSETKNQIKHQNILLRNILLIIGIFIVGFALILFIYYSMNHFEVNGIKYDIVKEKNVTFYHTMFLSEYFRPGMITKYHVYLRNDPRKLKNILFDGNLNLLEMAVIDSQEEFKCEGNGIIAIANFNQILHALGTQVVRDSEYSKCDSLGRYMFFNLKSGNETKIIQTGPACYDFVINNCEILEVTEKFLIESILLKK